MVGPEAQRELLHMDPEKKQATAKRVENLRLFLPNIGIYL
jgi:hypothetical protein